MPIKMTRDEYLMKYGQEPFSSTTTEPQEQQSESTESTESNATFPITGEETSYIGTAGKAIGNIPKGAYEFTKGAVSLVNPIEVSKQIGTIGSQFRELKEGGLSTGQILKQTVKNLPSAAYETLVPGFIKKAFETKGGIKEKAYESAKAVVEDPVGELAPLLLMGRGVLGKGKMGKAVDTSVSKVAAPVTKTLSKAAQVPGKVARATLGTTSGVGSAAFESAGKPGFAQAMRGKITPEQIVSEAQRGVSALKKIRSEEYSKAFETVQKENPKAFDISPAIKSLDKRLESFGAKVVEGQLDLSRSSLTNDAPKVQAIHDLVKEWGSRSGDRSIKGVDTLKQQLRQFKEANNPTLNKFIDDTANSVKDIIKDAKGYAEFEAKYGERSRLIEQLEESLSLDRDKNPDTAITKLMSTLKDSGGAEVRRNLLKELDQVTGTDLSAKIAGSSMKTLYPSSAISKTIPVIGGLITGFNLHLLPLLAASSPRLVGEFANVMGLTGRKLNNFLRAVNEFRVPEAVRDVMTKERKPKIGLGIEDISQTKKLMKAESLPYEALKEMDKFIEYVRTKAPKDYTLEANVRDMAKSFGINSDVPNAKLADKLTDVLDTTKYYELSKKGSPTMGEIADPLITEARKYKTAEEFVKAQNDPLLEFKTLDTIKNQDIARGTVKEAINDIGGIKNVRRGEVPISKLETTENINTNSERYKTVEAEVKRGVITPIIADEYLRVMDGHHRLKVYEQMGMENVPVIVPKTTPEVKFKTYSQLTDIWKKANKK